MNSIRGAFRPSVMRSLAVVTAFVLLSGACATSSRVALPEVQTHVNGVEILCAGGGYAQRPLLRGSPTDPAVTWLEVDGRRGANVLWPRGYTAAFSPYLVVFDAQGWIVAREGDVVRGGCPMSPDGELIHLSDT